MQILVTILQSIPSEFWASIAGAVFALSGVVLSNRSSAARLRLQLQHDAAEKSKERTTSMRREVYLQTIEELCKANAHLAALPNIDPAKSNIGEGFQGFFSSAARLQLVAETRTVLLVNALAGDYMELVFKLLACVQPAHSAKQDIEIANDLYSEGKDEIKRILGEIRKINESGAPNPAALHSLERSFDFQQSQCAKHASDRDAAWTRFHQANITFQKTVLASIRELAPRQIPVMMGLRHDLGLDGEADELEAQLRARVQRMEELFDKLVVQLNQASVERAS
jgi:hypothetical protein